MAGQIRILNLHEGFEGRPCREVINMSIAQIISLRGTCGRAKVGCVITRENRIISTAYNGPIGENHCQELHCDLETKCENAIHAEINAIAFAAKEGISLEGSTLYCTTMPCPNCARIIYQAGIKKVFYMSEYSDTLGITLLKGLGVEVIKNVQCLNFIPVKALMTYVN